jgi:hypothetical protein
MNPFILLNYWLFNKTETENEFVIRWADILVTNADSMGEIETSCFALDYHLSTLGAAEIKKVQTNPSKIMRDKIIRSIKQDTPDTVQLDPIVKELLRFRELIEMLLLKEDFIRPVDFNKKWILNERGKLMKELGGLHNYKKYRKSEIGIITNQGLINNLLISATGLAAVMPFFAAWLFSTKVYNTNVLPPSVYRPDIRIDSVWLHQQVDELIQKKLSSQKPTEAKANTPPR